MAFITENFLLQTKTAQRLYHEAAAEQPIFDYHCHLCPRDIAENRRFNDLFEIWLEGDHYKWRAMRSNGIAEKFCTGDATPFEKFNAFAETLPHTLRNPLYHWSHLELQRYFGITELLNAESASDIWERANAQLGNDELSAHGILKKFKVKALCTTDDPTDDLVHHQAIAADASLSTRVYPTFRPDRVLAIGATAEFNSWCDQLGAASNVDIHDLNSLLAALQQRHDAFHAVGCRLSDHGLETCFADFCSEAEATRIFAQGRSGGAVSPTEARQFASYMMVFFGQLDAEKGWTKQLHIGAMRNNSTRLLKAVGKDSGFDSIGDYAQGTALSRYLDELDKTNSLPKTILYNLNPADNYMMGTMIGNFQDGSLAGKIQWGSGWWFNDQKEGMEQQINALSNLGLLSRFVGMLTDSRSLLSYPRHEYFRRILCNLVGQDVENGELPDDWELLSGFVSRICFQNAKDYLEMETAE